MKKISIFITAVLLMPSCGLFKKHLEEKQQTVELTYIAWGCDCANWATPDDIEKYGQDFEDSLADRSIFIEPADSSLSLPDTLHHIGKVIEFTGHFYKEKGFPKNYSSIESPDKARVFQYSKYRVIESKEPSQNE